MGSHVKETVEVEQNGQRYIAERRKSGWFLIKYWDDTRKPAWDNEEFGWVFLLPNEQREIEDPTI